jgi:hypothetical protein
MSKKIKISFEVEITFAPQEDQDLNSNLLDKTETKKGFILGPEDQKLLKLMLFSTNERYLDKMISRLVKEAK